MTVFFEQVTLIGLGLIGSSLARAMKNNQLTAAVVGYDTLPETGEKSRKLGLVDSVAPTLEQAVGGADLVILCTPLGTYASLVKAMAPHLSPTTILTDVGSCKVSCVKDVQENLPNPANYVPGHPIAGTENSGPESGFAELFMGRYCILTPNNNTSEHALSRIIALWQAVGANVEIMEPHHHDRVMAMTSHLPHLIAYSIVGTAADMENHIKQEGNPEIASVFTNEVIRFSASGFRDFTRIAGSDPIMWRDVFLNNRDAVLEMLGRFSEDLMVLQRAVRWGDGTALEKWFRRTRDIRRQVIEQKQAGTFNSLEPELAVQRLKQKLQKKPSDETPPKP